MCVFSMKQDKPVPSENVVAESDSSPNQPQEVKERQVEALETSTPRQPVAVLDSQTVNPFSASYCS